MKDDDLDALAALDTLLDSTGRPDELVKIVERRAELADDPGVQLVLLHRIAGLYEDLEERPAAIAAFKNALAVDDTDTLALDALERLYRAEQDHTELANVLSRKIELAEEVGARRALRFSLATVYETHLNDPYEAIAQMSAVLEETANGRGGVGCARWPLFARSDVVRLA